MNNQFNVHQLCGREITQDEVHIWSASLDRPISQYYSLLAANERQRTERFHFEKDRNRFIVRRGILRILLGCYLGIEPESVLFSHGKNDKPGLADEFNRKRLRFSLSHSEGLAIYAFTGDHEIGIDIEQIRDMPEMEQIFERFFSLRENEVFHILPENRRKEAFFNCWTRKEAFIKATGDGLSMPLDKFDVSLVPGEPARLLRIEGDTEEVSRWSMQDLKGVSGFAAAFAMRGYVRNVHCWRWAD